MDATATGDDVLDPEVLIAPSTLHVRWLGSVPYGEALTLQRSLVDGHRNHLLLLEHPPVFTVGRSGNEANILVDPMSVGAEIHRVDRGGDVTLHAPGQLVGYPLVTVAGRGSGLAESARFVEQIEQLLIDALGDLGLRGAARYDGYTGVWLDPDTPRARKIAAIGVRLRRGRAMHGFALNVDIDRAWFDRLVPCGIPDKAVTSLAAEGIDVSMRDVVDAVALRAAIWWTSGPVDRADIVWRQRPEDLSAFSRGEGPGRIEPAVAQPKPQGQPVRLLGRLAEAGVSDGLEIGTPKPEYLRVRADLSPEYARLKSLMRDLDLVTVCEEAGCPNIFECWKDGTATFMINGERCTRACGFCLVDTRKPEPPDPEEPDRVAAAVAQLGLSYAVVTTVARDDLADGGAAGFAATISAIRARVPGCRVEVLISDCKGDEASLATIFDARPDVLNHNIESVARLQRAVRPAAGYARSLSVLGAAKQAGLVTKSSIIVGMGERFDEVVSTLADLAGVGLDIVTIGQYLRPTSNHLPIERWYTPDEFAELKRLGEAMGIGHVESSPLTRSSYHARQAEAAVTDHSHSAT